MSAELESQDAPHLPHAQIFLVLTDVNVNLDSLVMVITVSMSTNVLTIHAERMHHARILLVHTDAHVTEATKVTNCYVMCYVTYNNYRNILRIRIWRCSKNIDGFKFILGTKNVSCIFKKLLRLLIDIYDLNSETSFVLEG